MKLPAEFQLGGRMGGATSHRNKLSVLFTLGLWFLKNNKKRRICWINQNSMFEKSFNTGYSWVYTEVVRKVALIIFIK